MSTLTLNHEKTIHKSLGIEIEKATPDEVVLTMPVDERTHQPFGILHGGASVVLAESAASIGAYLNCDPSRQTAVGLEINANHIRPKRSGTVRARAVPLHKGRSTMVWEIKITDEQEKLICVSRCTMAIVELASFGH
ncbi:hotdog fold thioesterase [Desulfurispora thermophila]|uniref:hotdog fold thioesterase n=1 Tax=Desulfurispora thermophila TaxID=265470 RepID=UPI00035C54F8|nr:hotdog fold thioesterase [Desulfurispora thermophila]